MRGSGAQKQTWIQYAIDYSKVTEWPNTCSIQIHFGTLCPNWREFKILLVPKLRELLHPCEFYYGDQMDSKKSQALDFQLYKEGKISFLKHAILQ